MHRELLDWLAVEFIESGWDVKHLLRTIVTSDAYQRSSQVASAEVYERDPQNRRLTRGPRFRLPSWMIRDQALAVAGLLNRQIGGPPVYPYQPAGVWAEATFGKNKYRQDTGAALSRRSLYVFWRRIVGPTMFFDTAKRQVCEVQPLRTNTPLHALTTLNDTTYVEAARALAANVLSREPHDDQRFKRIYRSVLGRTPSVAEVRSAGEEPGAGSRRVSSRRRGGRSVPFPWRVSSRRRLAPERVGRLDVGVLECFEPG